MSKATTPPPAHDKSQPVRKEDLNASSSDDSAYLPISDYGLIGNLHTAALVCKSGSLDFLSYPRFDSATLFARLLDSKKGGFWSIYPTEAEALTASQYYEPASAILITRIMHSGGVIELRDYMPPVDDVSHCQIVRSVEALVGSTTLSFSLCPRYPYGAEAVQLHWDDAAKAVKLDVGVNPMMLFGMNSQELQLPGNSIDTPFTLSNDEGNEPSLRVFILQSASCKLPGERGVEGFGESLLQYTRDYWLDWTRKIQYQGRYRDSIVRSVVTLKLCTSAEFGSSVAAPTFGLPEELGGSRNWDYRYSWIRDSAFTMYAMLRLGLTQEAEQFIHWIQARCEELDDASELGLMYRVDGTTDLDEYEVDLAGYKNSKPVRVGNGASGQHQLDIYGELIDTVYIYDGHASEITYAFWLNLCEIINYVAAHWREADHGIWEVRNEKKHFTMSRVMAWVAIDRGIRIAQHRGFPAPYERWFKERDAIYTAIYTEHYDDKLDSWTSFPGSGKVDGSLLLMPLVRFVSPSEPKWQSTLKRIEHDLVDDCLVKRYLPEDGKADGLSGDEGYFTMCSCWYIEVIAKMGRRDVAQRLMTKLLSYGNHLGLFSEELAINGLQLGNFPQAFTHLGLISAILQLEQDDKKPRPFG